VHLLGNEGTSARARMECVRPQGSAGIRILGSSFPCLSDLAASIFLLREDGYGPNDEVLLRRFAESCRILVRLLIGSLKWHFQDLANSP
jgi:hypothetical protein